MNNNKFPEYYIPPAMRCNVRNHNRHLSTCIPRYDVSGFHIQYGTIKFTTASPYLISFFMSALIYGNKIQLLCTFLYQQCVNKPELLDGNENVEKISLCLG